MKAHPVQRAQQDILVLLEPQVPLVHLVILVRGDHLADQDFLELTV